MRRFALPFFVAAAAAMAATAPLHAAAVVDTSPVPPKNTASALPEHWHRGAFMEIFVRAWKDSNGDGIGDLRGLISTLDDLKDLGIRGIWLMPIQANADGDHGYATTDFRAIAPEYGTLADFDELIRQAHRRGIGVVMDYVINHSAAQHPAFVEALKGDSNPYRNWYVWKTEMPTGWDIWGKNPWYAAEGRPWQFNGHPKDLPPPPPGARNFYFGTFGPHMPDFDLTNPVVWQYHEDSLRFWLERGLDGYRLDAVPHMVETDAVNWNDQPASRVLTKRLQDLIKTYRHRFVVCEATAEPRIYGDPAVCGGAFAFGFVHHYVKAARGDAASVAEVAGYFARTPPTMATFVSSHDIFAGRRLWDQLDGYPDREARYKLAAAAYLLQPGTPFVYYGEEIGQAGVHGALDAVNGDWAIRSPRSWTADARGGGFTTGTPFRPLAPNLASHNVALQKRDPNSIRNFYKTMIGLRNAHPSIARGSYEQSFAIGTAAGWQRRLGNDHTLTLLNFGTAAFEVRLPGLPAGARLVPLYPRHGLRAQAGADGSVERRLAPLSVAVYRVVAPGRPDSTAVRR
jgi:alpha-amylase